MNRRQLVAALPAAAITMALPAAVLSAEPSRGIWLKCALEDFYPIIGRLLESGYDCEWVGPDSDGYLCIRRRKRDV